MKWVERLVKVVRGTYLTGWRVFINGSWYFDKDVRGLFKTKTTV